MPVLSYRDGAHQVQEHFYSFTPAVILLFSLFFHILAHCTDGFVADILVLLTDLLLHMLQMNSLSIFHIFFSAYVTNKNWHYNNMVEDVKHSGQN